MSDGPRPWSRLTGVVIYGMDHMDGRSESGVGVIRASGTLERLPHCDRRRLKRVLRRQREGKAPWPGRV